MSKTPKYIMDFISVLAPGNEELYLSFFQERIAIIDATKTIERLEAENERLKDALRQVSQYVHASSGQEIIGYAIKGGK